MAGAAQGLVITAASCAPPAPPPTKAGCDQDYERLTGRVVDTADLLTAAQEEEIAAKLRALERRTHHQMVVATVSTLQGKPIETYSLCLANHWGLGRKEHDDGLLLLVAPKERKVRIEVGKGLEKRLTDREAKAVIDRQILPAFRTGHMGRGIEAGVNAMIAEVQ